MPSQTLPAGARTTGAHDTPVDSIRVTGADDSGGISSPNPAALEDLDPLHQIRNDQFTNDGNGARND